MRCNARCRTCPGSGDPDAGKIVRLADVEMNVWMRNQTFAPHKMSLILTAFVDLSSGEES